MVLYSGTVTTAQSGALAEATADSDLVPHGTPSASFKSDLRSLMQALLAVYEGGFKLWECAVDLCEYMMAKDFAGKPALLAGPVALSATVDYSAVCGRETSNRTGMWTWAARDLGSTGW